MLLTSTSDSELTGQTDKAGNLSSPAQQQHLWLGSSSSKALRVSCAFHCRNITEIAVLEGEQMEFNDDSRKLLA